ncbi:hypothetical protein PYCC9005_004590 [Savitreella phatthalungensis]
MSDLGSLPVHSAFREKYDSVLSCCRLLTEAQATLNRSLRDLANVASQLPGLEGINVDALNAGLGVGASGDFLDDDLTVDGKRKKKEKKEKDPNMPKRPRTSYLMYANDVMANVRDNMTSGAGAGEIMKNVAARWKTLDEATKNHYNQRYQNELDEWRQRTEAYKQQKSLENARTDDEAAAAMLAAAGPGALEAQQPKKRGRKPKSLQGGQGQGGSGNASGAHQHEMDENAAAAAAAAHHHHHAHGLSHLQNIEPGLQHHHAIHPHLNLPYMSGSPLSYGMEMGTNDELQKKKRKKKDKS